MQQPVSQMTPEALSAAIDLCAKTDAQELAAQLRAMMAAHPDQFPGLEPWLPAVEEIAASQFNRGARWMLAQR